VLQEESVLQVAEANAKLQDHIGTSSDEDRSSNSNT
jgi:hypothetical protein